VREAPFFVVMDVSHLFSAKISSLILNAKLKEEISTWLPFEQKYLPLPIPIDLNQMKCLYLKYE
jgi:hypothetical protein